MTESLTISDQTDREPKLRAKKLVQKPVYKIYYTRNRLNSHWEHGNCENVPVCIYRRPHERCTYCSKSHKYYW